MNKNFSFDFSALFVYLLHYFLFVSYFSLLALVGCFIVNSDAIAGSPFLAFLLAIADCDVEISSIIFLLRGRLDFRASFRPTWFYCFSSSIFLCGVIVKTRDSSARRLRADGLGLLGDIFGCGLISSTDTRLFKVIACAFPSLVGCSK